VQGRSRKWRAEGYFHFARKKAIRAWACTPGISPATWSSVTDRRNSTPRALPGAEIRHAFAQIVHHQLFISPAARPASCGQQAKFRFLDEFESRTWHGLARERDFVLCGDVNIAHKEQDLKNWRSNRKNSGFLPEERA